MRLHRLLEGTGCIGPLPRDVEVKGISYDTRTIKPGEVFVALHGYKTDGHRYMSQARAQGAAAVVCEEGPGIRVPDARAALAAMSANWFGHPGSELELVGVTGTNGKTTVTTLLWSVLGEALETKVGLLGTNVNRIGERLYPAQRTTPESYETQQWLRQMADGGCTHVVMEVSSHALCLHRVDGLTFSVGAFTNLTQDHLDFHKTMEAYRQAKGRLFAQSRAAVINTDDPAGEYYVNQISGTLLTYSASGSAAGLWAKNAALHPDRVEFQAVAGGEETAVRVNIPGGFTVYNALCVLGCARALGISLPAAAGILARTQGVKGRMEVVPTPGPGTVIIDYAHTPDALENALTALRGFTGGRLICLFGCGGDRDRGKRPIMGSIAQGRSDLCVVTSDNPRTEAPEAIIDDILAGMEADEASILVEPDRPTAIRLALEQLREGDVLLLAGKGHETYQEVKGEKRHMDERELVAAYFS